MAKDKKSFLLYCDLIHTVKKLSDEQSGKLFKHILSYVNDENPVTEDVLIDLVFEPIKQQLKRDLIRYESMCERNKDNGSKGGRPKSEPIQPEPKKPTGLSRNPKNPNEPDKENDIDSDSGIDNDKEILRGEFDKFWNIYNKKIGDKEKLFTKWLKIKPSDKNIIFQTLPRYVASTEKQFRKNPETYLNNHSWNDEIVTKTQQLSPQEQAPKRQGAMI